MDMADYLEGGKLDANAILEMMIKMQKEILNQVASQPDLDDLRIQVDNNKKNIIDLEVQNQKLQVFSEQAEGRIGTLESQTDKNTADIEELKRLLADVSKKVEGKLECEFFDEEMQKMRNLIASLGSGMGSGGNNQVAA